MRSIDMADRNVSSGDNRGGRAETARRFVARVTAGLGAGTVEGTLDRLARQEGVDVDLILVDLHGRMGIARADPGSVSRKGERSPVAV